MTRLLAIDTAQANCAVAVLTLTDGGETLVSRSEAIGRGHAEALMPMIEAVMGEAGVTFADIDRIAVTCGPGSFTGLRVGLSVARGFALVRQIPAVGISVLDGLAAEARSGADGRPVLAVLEAREDEIYAAFYDETGHPAGEPEVALRHDLAGRITPDMVLTGSAAPALAQACGLAGVKVHGTATVPDIATVARLGAAAQASGLPPVPLYLRPPDAKPQLKGRIERI